jgi:hypothetical protein
MQKESKIGFLFFSAKDTACGKYWYTVYSFKAGWDRRFAGLVHNDTMRLRQ